MGVENMKLVVLPNSLSGKLAAILCGAFVILFFLKVGGLMPLPTFAIFALGFAGLIAGIVAIIKKDRSILVYLSLLVGLFVVIWTSAELLFPH
jgi:hypothetical protein